MTSPEARWRGRWWSNGLRRWRLPLSLGAGLVAVVVALTLPAPAPPVPSAAPNGAGANGEGAHAPPRLAQVWPAAKVFVVAAALSGGSSFQPMLVLDASPGAGASVVGPSVVGLATSPDLSTSRLVIRAGDGTLRELRSLAGQQTSGQQTSTVAAVTVAGGQVYWLELTDTGEGARQATVWRADQKAGSARLLARDSSDVLYYDSAYDLQVTDGQVRWASAGPGRTGELRTVPIDGGPVGVRPLSRLYALTAWPWVTSSGGSQPGDVELLNLNTGERRTVGAGPSEILTCTPVWCRVTTLVNQGQSLKFEVERVNGDDRRVVGNTTLTPLNVDVALLDRFEVLASTAPGGATGYAQRLWLHDLSTNRAVLLDDAVTATIGSRGPFLWWSTGNNEILSWHILDLRQLT